MHILRKNYFSKNLLEAWEGDNGGAISEDLKPDTRLLEIKEAIVKGQTEFPDGGEAHLKWMYYCLINGIQTTVYPTNDITIAAEDSVRSHELWTYYRDIPEALNEWITQYCFTDGEDDLTPFASKIRNDRCKNMIYDLYYNKNIDFGWFNKTQSQEINAIYEYHKRAIATYTESQKIPIDVVHDFLAKPKWPENKNALSVQSQMPALETIIAKLPTAPQVDIEQAKKDAENVTPNDYDTIYNYARDIGTDVRKAVAVVARFAAAACPTPYATLDVVEDVRERQQQIDLNTLDLMTRDNTVGFVGRMFNRQRPAPYEQTPLFEIAEMAQSIPDKAKEDSARHAEHVTVLQKGLDIIHGYDDSLRAYIKALEDRKKIIDQTEKHEAEELTTRDIADGILGDAIDDKLNDLKASRAFARAHAANFATLLLPVMKAQGQLEGIAGLGANVLLPMQQIQRAFLSYQSEQFGKAIASNNDIIEGTATEIGQIIPAGNAKDVMEQSMHTLSLMIEKIQDDISQSREEIIDIATKTEKAAARGEALEVKKPSP